MKTPQDTMIIDGFVYYRGSANHTKPPKKPARTERLEVKLTKHAKASFEKLRSEKGLTKSDLFAHVFRAYRKQVKAKKANQTKPKQGQQELI